MGYVIAIDGPAGAGKSTIARTLAGKLGCVYIDSGAMYRAVALRALRAGVSFDDAPRLEELARASRIELLPQLAQAAGSGSDRRLPGSRVTLDDEDVSVAIREPEVSAAASRVAAMGGVRAALVAKQQLMARHTDVVMEGRDIGTVVFPDATVKIFLDADPAERVRRRAGEQPEIPPEVLAGQLAERDARDRNRVQSPLVQAHDALYLDSTGLSPEEVVDKILALAQSRIPKGTAH